MIKTRSEVELIKLIVSMYPNEVSREIRRREIFQNDKLGMLGHCSICGGSDGSFNIGRSNYFYCTEHKKYWCIGENIISDWREETKDIWKINKKKFAKFEQVDADEWLSKKIKSENLDIEADLEKFQIVDSLI